MNTTTKPVFLVLGMILSYVESLENKQMDTGVDLSEVRGNAMNALLLHFFYVAATKLIVLKVIYGIILYVLAIKAWKFGIWLIHYLKGKKQDHHYIEHHHGYGHEFDHGHNPDHNHYSDYGVGPYDIGYKLHGTQYQSNTYEKDLASSAQFEDSNDLSYGQSYGGNDLSFKKKVYDSDGSFSVYKSRKTMLE